MTERIMYPNKPDDVVKEIFHPNLEIIDEFSKHFPKEILVFGETFSEAYKKYLELLHYFNDTNDEQEAYVFQFTYMILDNLFTSVKLMVAGYPTPSGNLMRQAVEGVAVVVLCSLKDKVKIQTDDGEIIERHYFSSLKEEKYYAQPHKALSILETNINNIRMNEEAIVALNESKKFFSLYSHPTFFSSGSFTSFETPGKFFMGGGFDKGKINFYQKEILNRIAFCSVLPNLISWLILQLKRPP